MCVSIWRVKSISWVILPEEDCLPSTTLTVSGCLFLRGLRWFSLRKTSSMKDEEAPESIIVLALMLPEIRAVIVMGFSLPRSKVWIIWSVFLEVIKISGCEVWAKSGNVSGQRAAKELEHGTATKDGTDNESVVNFLLERCRFLSSIPNFLESPYIYEGQCRHL